ncbi:MAG: tol-pal system-associated acyl-CoA thioesterase [Candidatus Pelagadaptatus aseana]|uniref:tol-pal system-associated acyl-CoA thioesterase n=1 Tax=Candidatus Pelagadaptatus aseana TaxID=3120508 RepID=UPI0039B188B4
MSDSDFSMPVRVYIEDTDAGGIVYYVNYLKYMERARTELMRSLGYDKPAFMEEDKLMVVHSANINYRRPALLDDSLTATAVVSKLARSYLVFQQKIWRDRELLCEGEIKVACVHSDGMKPAPLPQSVRESVAAVMDDQQ